LPKSVFTEKYNRFRELLIEARHNQSLTQAQVAKKLKKPQSYVSKYELGERRLDVVEFLEIARVLEINVCEFLRILEKGEGKTRGRK